MGIFSESIDGSFKYQVTKNPMKDAIEVAIKGSPGVMPYRSTPPIKEARALARSSIVLVLASILE